MISRTSKLLKLLLPLIAVATLSHAEDLPGDEAATPVSSPNAAQTADEEDGFDFSAPEQTQHTLADSHSTQANPPVVDTPAELLALGDGMVFGQQPAPTPVEQGYQPDWSRFEKEGLFGVRKTGPVTANTTVDLHAAEAHYLELLNMKLPDAQRQKTLLDLAQLYGKYNVRPKEAAVYERYIESWPQDQMVPEIYMRLGFIYREIGAFKTSLSKFYSVLNATLGVNRAEMDTYKLLSLKAQIEIADTYYAMGDYGQAAKFYMRLKRLDMAQEDRVRVDFKFAYTQYLLKDYAMTISGFKSFIREYPDDYLVAEAHFVLASAYKQINQPRAALEEVLSLLKYQDSRRENAAMWTYWKKRTGNQLGNEFYEQGDFESALRIYQAMAPLSADPEWQWPVVYQIGLCFERLYIITKAVEAYDYIISQAETLQKDGTQLSERLGIILDQARWRRQQISWQNDANRQVQQIMAK
ncbi:MAG: hypothetical protein JW942_04555 [Opitutales bacterium]|nr:hypothetical protein [Opitutales bacterium]